jgi:hypothetical protein
VIDPVTETLLTPAQAGRKFPSTRDGKYMGPQAVIRLHRRPARAADGSLVLLEMVRFGGRLFTSAEAIQRYVAALSAGSEDQAAASIRTPADRQRAAEAARAELAAAGF